jgi:putative ABC transport system permease protein
MPDRRSINRSMFWRVLRRSVFANRGRLFVILLALGAGAAITAALLNLQVDAKRRITTEFRVFGANIVVVPSGSGSGWNSLTLKEEEVRQVVSNLTKPGIFSAPFLYFTVGVQKAGEAVIPGSRQRIEVIGAGTDLGAPLPMLIPGWANPQVTSREEADTSEICLVGVRVARQLGVHEGDELELSTGGRIARLRVFQIVSVGSDADDQVILDLKTAQVLAQLNGQASLVEINYPGSPAGIERFRSQLAAKLPSLQVRAIRQFTEGEARLYGRISGILTAMVVVVLVLTALCVMAAMTNVAMERKNDVGLMKAIGGSVRRVLRLFLAEAALLGLAAGLIGAAIGIVLSIGLGKAVFGVAAQPRLIVYPISVALTVIVAILAAYPLRRLVHIRPASVFRGEE